MNTNWNTPKTNVFAGILDLRQALASGSNARLRRARNKDCAYPIKIKKNDTDFRNYEFSNGTLQTRHNILNDTQKSDFEKHLSLTYKTCYGAAEAVERYYKTGLLSQENFKGQGTSYLVKVEDIIRFSAITGDKDRANMFRKQYFDEHTGNETHFYDNYRYKHGSPWAIKEFKKRVWVTELLGDGAPRPRTPFLIKVLNTILYPIKFIPTKSVLRMPEYKCVTFRIGSVTNGLSVEFQVPKRFSFKDIHKN